MSTSGPSVVMAAALFSFHSNAVPRGLPRLGRRAAGGIARAAAAQQKKAPPQLWHAVLFFTAGELTRREMEAYGDEDYVEHALRGGVYDRACGGCRPLLLKHWDPRLNGRVSIDDALSALVAAFGVGASP